MKENLLELENHRLAGVYYRSYSVEQVLDDYNKSLRKGKKVTVGVPELIPEPENLHDPNAIKVLIDGYHVGYIKSGSCAHVRQLIDGGLIHHLSATIYRGEDDDSGDPAYTVTLTIHLNAL